MVWIDLETGGLRPEHEILEVGIRVTNRLGDERATFQSVVGHYTYARKHFNRRIMDREAYEMHAKNNLINEVRKASDLVLEDADCGYGRVDVETRALEFLEVAFGGVPAERIPMAGASVQFDRAALRVQMRRLHNWFHYRQYDVSTLLQFGAMVGHQPDETVQRRGYHRAIPDIEDEISVHRWATKTLIAQV